MHELPQDLTTSLKSFRGSIYSSNRASGQHDVDVEKGETYWTPNRHDGEDLQSLPIGTEDFDTHNANGVPDGTRADEVHDTSSHQLKHIRQKLRPQRPVVDAKGGGEQTPANGDPKTPAGMSVFHAPEVHDPDPAAERLADDETPLSDEDFLKLMGMRKPTSAREERQDERYPFKLAAKHGLYRTICDDLRYIQYKYRIFDIMTYVLLALQILIGAVFIILGALRDERTYLAIAILGGVSTVIGGILALMKGQGLPNRLRQARDQMRNVVFEAEELYWDFRSGRPIIYADIKKIREDYLRVLEEVRKNHPDTWTNAASQAAKSHSRKGGRS